MRGGVVCCAAASFAVLFLSDSRALAAASLLGGEEATAFFRDNAAEEAVHPTPRTASPPAFPAEGASLPEAALERDVRASGGVAGEDSTFTHSSLAPLDLMRSRDALGGNGAPSGVSPGLSVSTPLLGLKTFVIGTVLLSLCLFVHLNARPSRKGTRSGDISIATRETIERIEEVMQPYLLLDISPSIELVLWGTALSFFSDGLYNLVASAKRRKQKQAQAKYPLRGIRVLGVGLVLLAVYGLMLLWPRDQALLHEQMKQQELFQTLQQQELLDKDAVLSVGAALTHAALWMLLLSVFFNKAGKQQVPVSLLRLKAELNVDDPSEASDPSQPSEENPSASPAPAAQSASQN